VEALGPRPLDFEGARVAGDRDDLSVSGETLPLVAGDG
jgi:hypothetical protein